MMTLMKETEEHKKRNKSSLVTLIVCLTAMVAILILSVGFGMSGGASVYAAFIDVPSLLMLLVPMLLILAAAGMIKPFFSAFCMLGADCGNYTKQQVEKTKRALRLGANSLLVMGILETLATIILVLGYYNKGLSAEQVLANIAVAMLGCLYGIVAYLLLLPIRCRLDEVTEE